MVLGIRWGWFFSLAIGIGVILLSLVMIRSASLPDGVGELSGESGVVGITMLVFALPALGSLLLPSVSRLYSNRNFRLAWRKSRQPGLKPDFLSADEIQA